MGRCRPEAGVSGSIPKRSALRERHSFPKHWATRRIFCFHCHAIDIRRLVHAETGQPPATSWLTAENASPSVGSALLRASEPDVRSISENGAALGSERYRRRKRQSVISGHRPNGSRRDYGASAMPIIRRCTQRYGGRSEIKSCGCVGRYRCIGFTRSTCRLACVLARRVRAPNRMSVSTSAFAAGSHPKPSSVSLDNTRPSRLSLHLRSFHETASSALILLVFL